MESEAVPFNIEEIKISGRNLIEASAGTGKTYGICRIYLKALLENPIKFNVKSILVITYTNAATDELKKRIRSILKEAVEYYNGNVAETDDYTLLKKFNKEKSLKILKQALFDFDEASIFTIHGFCKKVIDEYNLAFTDEIVPDDTPFLEEFIKDFWRKNIVNSDEKFLRYMIFEKKLTVDRLTELSKNILNRIKIKILPEPVKDSKKFTVPDIKDKYEIIREKKEKLIENNVTYIEEIEKIFNNDILKKNVYSEKICKNLIESLETYLSQDSLLPFNDLSKLKQSRIESSVKKGKKLPGCNAFLLMEEIYNVSEEIKKAYDTVISAMKSYLFSTLHGELLERKEKVNVMSFNDVLIKLHNALFNGETGKSLSEKIGKKYKLAMIDEFQDTDPVQYEIFKKIFFEKDNAVFFIGDPKQSIYSFRGGDIFTYIKASKEIEKKYTLDKCFRSEKKIVEAVNEIFSTNDNPFVFKDINYHKVNFEKCKLDIKVENPFNILEIKGENLNKKDLQNIAAKSMVGRINGLAREYGINLGSIAILVRSHEEASFYNEYFKKYNIPSIIYSDKSVFESEEAFEIEKIIKAVLNPTDKRCLFTALTTSVLGKTLSDIEELKSSDKLFEEKINDFAGYKEKWLNYGFMKMFYELTEKEEVLKRLMSYRKGERKLTNFLHIAELLHNAGETLDLTMEGILKWLNERRTGKVKSADYELRLESDKNAVQIVTIHKSKGLEYPFLFFPFFWGKIKKSGNNEVLFHNENNELVLHLEGDDKLKLIEKNEKFSEYIRLFYVAITRAVLQCNCYVYSEKNYLKNDILQYLTGNQAEERLEKYITVIDDNEDIKNYSFEVSDNKTESLEFKKFKGKIERRYIVDSFTKMAYRRDNEKFDEINFANFHKEELTRANMFTLPKGARTGNLLHKIFESIDFDCNDNELTAIIEREVKNFNFDIEKWENVIFENIKKVSSISLVDFNGEKICLSKIGNDKKISELEFYLKLKDESNFLKNVRDNTDNFFKNALSDITSYQIKTYLRGFIDLVFEYNDKFYIVDWKSNFLGDSISDYTRENLKQVVKENLYFLQYHIYSAAFFEHLKLRMRNFTYDNFGGVFYIFLRGVGENTGIYYDRPGKNFFDRL